MFPQSMVLRKNMKNIKRFLLKIFNFYEISVYIALACFRNVMVKLKSVYLSLFPFSRIRWSIAIWPNANIRGLRRLRSF